MSHPQWLLWICALITGLLLVPVRLVVAFFPFFNITEVLVFGGICFLLAIAFKPKSWLWALVVAAPTCWQVLRIVRRLGLDRISDGVGTGHALSLLLIPVAAWLGAFLGQRFVQSRWNEVSSTSR
jgi:hypothetical protein